MIEVALDQHADKTRDHDRKDDRGKELDSELVEEVVDGVRAQHQECAVGEVHDVHDAEDERQSGRHEAVEASQHEGVHERLKKQDCRHSTHSVGAIAI